jgi:hypothetical protein
MYSTPLIAVAFFLFLLKKSWEKVWRYRKNYIPLQTQLQK